MAFLMKCMLVVLMICVTTSNGDSRCTFLPGDGIGGTEIKVGNQKGSACILACIEKRKTDSSINGVAVHTDASKNGCWCERNMKSRNSATKWKSCFIGDTGLNGDSRCTFVAGDGIGGKEIKVGDQRGSACIDACIAKRQTDSSINGVTVFTDTSKRGCWCEVSMNGRSSVTTYKSCFIDNELNGDSRCKFIAGDGIGGKEIKVGKQRGSACVDACLERRQTDSAINGVTVYTDTSKLGCWCELRMSGRNSVNKWKSCFLGESGLSGDSRCNFLTGDGIGGTEIKVGNQKGSACVDACLEKKETDGAINGVTVFTDTSKSGCWCESRMQSRNSATKYKSCFISEVGAYRDSRCTFLPGDGIGGTEIKVGQQTGSACISACIEKRKTDTSINGVAVHTDDSKTGCWCERNMNGRNSVTKWKSCFLGTTGLDGDSRCTFLRGRGIDEFSLKVGNQRGSQCIDVCLTKQQTDKSIIGVTVFSNTTNNGCWCQKSMAVASRDATYKSCYIGDAGLNGDSRCTFTAGDGTGGSEIKAGNQKGSACIDACIEIRQLTDKSINGVTVYSDTSKSGCWCERAMNRQNSNKRWKSCYLHTTTDEPAVEHGDSCTRNFRKIGCFKRDWLKVTDLLVTDLDSTHVNFTQAMNWEEYPAGLRSLACRCREKAQGNYKYFAIGFHAECVAGKDYKALEKMFEREEVTSGCINGKNEVCNKNHKAECTGEADYDFFYEV